jgi:hypothetical protein
MLYYDQFRYLSLLIASFSESDRYLNRLNVPREMEYHAMSPDLWMSSCSKSLVAFNALFERSVGSLLINMSIALITAFFKRFFGTVSPFAALANGPNSTKNQNTCTFNQ